MNCWPTIPVAPRTPTGIVGINVDSKKKADAETRVGGRSGSI
jgi:hypothetical protein